MTFSRTSTFVFVAVALGAVSACRTGPLENPRPQLEAAAEVEADPAPNAEEPGPTVRHVVPRNAPVFDPVIFLAPAWHLPVEERPPANPATEAVVEVLDTITNTFTETRYQHRTHVRERRGVYNWDCSGMAGWIVERTAPRAYRALDDDRPVARDFYDIIEDSPIDRARHGWQRIAEPNLIAPGDVFAWRKPDIFRDRPGTGHVGFVVETPQPHPDHENVWLVRIADSSRYRHGSDSRPPEGEGGFGTGVMAFLFGDDGAPLAYGWYGSSQNPTRYVATQIAFGRVSR